MDWGLFFSFLAVLMAVVFFILARSISKERKGSSLDKEKRGKFYAKVTALAIVGLSVAACASVSAIILIKELSEVQ